MKWLYIFSLIVLAFILVRCFFAGNKIVYVFKSGENIFEFEPTNGDTAKLKKSSIDFSVFEINTAKKDPFSLYFIFTETLPNVKTLKSVEANLYTIGKNNELTKQEANCEMKVEYYNGNYIDSKTYKNNTQPLHSLTDWDKVEYTYKFLDKEYKKSDNTVSYFFSYKFAQQEYTDSVKLEVILNWENGQRKTERILAKTDYKGPKINPKY